jgi:hypothetical protein
MPDCRNDPVSGRTGSHAGRIVGAHARDGYAG